MAHGDKIEQRADKIKITRTEEGEEGDVGVHNVEHYTMKCDECGGTGYYDDLFMVICDGCGRVLSGDAMPVLNVDGGGGENNAGNNGEFVERHHEPMNNDMIFSSKDPSI